MFGRLGSTVTWTLGGSGAPYTTLFPQIGMGPSVYLWGGDGSATVPDLSALGSWELSHGAKYTLGVWRTSSAQTVEDFASMDYVSTLNQKPSTGRQHDVPIDVTTSIRQGERSAAPGTLSAGIRHPARPRD